MNTLSNRLITCAALLSVATTSGAYVLLIDPALPTVTTKWRVPEIQYYINPDGSGLSNDQVIQVVQNSFASWTNTGIGVSFRYMGITSHKDNAKDHINTIFWDVDQTFVPVGKALAKTEASFDSTGAIVGADIGFATTLGTSFYSPTRGYCGGTSAFRFGGIPLYWRIGTQGVSPGLIPFLSDVYSADVQATLTHEIGHLLGLGHTPVANATMSVIQSSPSFFCSTDQGNLKADDIAGARFLYPQAAASPATWTQLLPATSPPARHYHVMSPDGGRGQVLLFGGQASGSFTVSGPPLSDTWIWDGTNWSQRFPSNSPSSRFSSAIAPDPIAGATVLFGGLDPAVTPSPVNDTWVWDGTNWSQKSPLTRPAPRSDHAMSSGSGGTSNVVMFGGTFGGFLNDTWVWNGITWTAMTPLSKPSGRIGHVMAYDAAHREVVLFGGLSSTGGDGTGTSIILNDTWIWNGSDWTQRFPLVNPPPMYRPAMAFDSVSHKMVLYSGNAQYGSDLQTWEWDGNNWKSINTAINTLLGLTWRFGYSMVFDPTRQQVLLFGGGLPTFEGLNDTWVYRQ
jgi:hypothetical protein